MSDATVPTRHDGLLAAVPISIAGGAVAGWLWTASLVVGLALGGVFAALLIGVSLFVFPP